MIAARERLNDRVPAPTDTHATIDVLLKTGVSTVVRAEELYGRQLGQASQFPVWRRGRILPQ
jgi:hypothetical protein